MSIPSCPVHKSPMNPGKKPGTFYCPRKVGDAWCDQKYPAPSQTSILDPGSRDVTAGTSHADLRAIAALESAAMVYRGTADQSGFLDLANAIMAGFWGGPRD